MRDTVPAWPPSLREINDLPRADKRAIYQTLIPDWILSMFGITPHGPTIDGSEAIRIRCPSGSTSVEVSVYPSPEQVEPALYLHLGDTFNLQLIVLLVVAHDPSAPRFNVDIDEHGRSTQLGACGRNIPEEIRAMQAGLMPGQVRRGLRVFRATLPAFETFVAKMGHDLFLIEPMFYHNAIAFERYGFAYTRGLQDMRTIHSEFRPGGAFWAKLDGSTPFRQPDAWRSISGRSWAIQDGILGRPFTGVQMSKRVGEDAGVDTCPGAIW
jgi:hypothetical protein